MPDLFWRLHDGLPRQAPGSDASTRLLLDLARPWPDRPRIVDVGCGPGRSSLVLATATGGHVTAVDLHEPFLADLDRAASRAGVADRITTLAASMDALPLPDGGVDLVWSEGAAYVMGFDAALASWRRLLAPGGCVVLTELEWTTVSPSEDASAFWAEGYPAMRTTAENVASAMRAGWTVRATYQLPDDDWWDEYYAPIVERLDALGEVTDPSDVAVVAAERAEIDCRRDHGDEYAYTGYVLTPRSRRPNRRP